MHELLQLMVSIAGDLKFDILLGHLDSWVGEYIYWRKSLNKWTDSEREISAPVQNDEFTRKAVSRRCQSASCLLEDSSICLQVSFSGVFEDTILLNFMWKYSILYNEEDR